MIRFLLKGLLRDKSRSRVPIMVVAVGVLLTVLVHAYVTGFIGDSIELSAKFSAGHVKIMTQPYAENQSQSPNDLAIIGVDSLLIVYAEAYPDIEWAQRIKFGGLIDVPDENGETKTQGPAAGFALDMVSEQSKEIGRLKLNESLVRGTVPKNPGEALISEQFSQKLQVNPGDTVTLLGSTMNLGMASYNFVVSGTIKFGSEVLDKGTIIADIEDVKIALDMNDAVGEILGFLKAGYYDKEYADRIKNDFNENFFDESDEYTPVMQTLKDEGAIGQYVEMADYMTGVVTMIFMIAMSLVLWNAGLLGALRRYGEVGIRLAIGEEKGHIYRSLILESLMIGIIGSIVGTAFGLFFAWLLQEFGIDIASMMQGSSIMMPSRIHARITPIDFYIGFIPGVISTVIGTMLAGIGIYKRQTARLFKELEA